jgi:threonine synthase
MGVVTSVSRIERDGAHRHRSGRETVAESGDLVRYAYDYGPRRLPKPGDPAAGMWRFRELLPLDDGVISYPLEVGATPLIAASVLRTLLKQPRLWLKDETRGPTGSNKDRATALVLEQALRAGVGTVSCASTGNVAASLAVGAAASGLRAVVFVPTDVNPTKLRLMLHAGAVVLRVHEGYTAAFQLSREAARELGWADRNTGTNPNTAEAKKTVAFEIWEQLGHSVPDVVFAPVGDGVTLWAIAKGFDELQACGAVHKLPRLIGVQSEGCDPVVRAWASGSDIRPVASDTIADGIAVPDPVLGAAAIQAVKKTGGAFVAVPDEEIMRAIQLLGRHAGLIAEPAGATAMAGFVTAQLTGLVDPGESAVVLVTGSGLKMPQHLRPASEPIAIHATLDEVHRHVGGQCGGL